MLLNLLNGLVKPKKNIKIDTDSLPSRGLFYKPDFWVKIGKASQDDIDEYEYYFNEESPFLVVELIKRVVKRNVVLAKGYTFEYIRAIDVIYIFLEIVKITCEKKIYIADYNDLKEEYVEYEFCPDNFSYFTPPNKYKYNKEELCYEYKGFKFRFPSIGVEESIVLFSTEMASIGEEKWDYMSYDFCYFLGDKLELTTEEIKNILLIFNEDMDINEKKDVDEIVNYFRPMFKYSLKINNKIINIDGRIGLKTIFKDE